MCTSLAKVEKPSKYLSRVSRGLECRAKQQRFLIKVVVLLWWDLLRKLVLGFCSSQSNTRDRKSVV